jgi:arginine-tRNA-protein transferase
MSVYKPNMQRTCCPAYTIRLEVDAFSPSKDQARVLRRMQRYLDGTYEGPVTVGEIQKDDQKLTSQRPGKLTSNSSPATPSDKDQSVNEKLLSNGRQNSGKKRQPDVLDESGRKLSLAIQCSIAGCVELGVLSPDFNQQDVTVRKFAEKAHGKLKDLDGQVEYTSNVAFAIAAAMKRKRNGTVQIDRMLGVDNETGLSKEELLPEHIAEILASRLQHSDLCGLIVQACKGHLNFLMSESRVGSDTSSPMEVSTSQGDPAQGVHQCEPRKQLLQEANGQKGGTQKLLIAPQLTVKTRQMEIKMQKSAFDAEEFALYKKYQVGSLCNYHNYINQLAMVHKS